MTRGQEIAAQIWAVPVTELTEPDAAAVIDAAIAEAVRKQTVKCANAADKVLDATPACGSLCCCPCHDRIHTKMHDAIIALNDPPVPLWKHKYGCHTPFQWNAKLQRWALPDKVDGVTECTHKSWHYCPSCGAARPDKEGN